MPPAFCAAGTFDPLSADVLLILVRTLTRQRTPFYRLRRKNKAILKMSRRNSDPANADHDTSASELGTTPAEEHKRARTRARAHHILDLVLSWGKLHKLSLIHI